GKLRKAKADFDNARDTVDQAKQVLKARQENLIYRGLNTAVLPMAILMLEVWNVQAEHKAFSVVSRNRSELRALMGLGSGVYDGVLASTVLAEKFAQNIYAGRLIARGTDFRPIALSRTLAERFPKAAEQLTLKRLAGSISGYLFAGISFTDAWHE